MVEIVSDSTSRTDPRSLNDIDWTQVRPSMMLLTESDELRPMEFLDMKNSYFGEYQDIITTQLDPFYEKSNATKYTTFFHDLAKKLSQHDRLNIYGVCVRHRDSITSVDPTFSSLETNHPRERWLRLDPMIKHEAKKKAIEAKWRRGEASATYWSFPAKCSGCSHEKGMCAECGCSGGICAECGCWSP